MERRDPLDKGSHTGDRPWRVRAGTSGDLPFLRLMLYEAASWNPLRPRRPLDEVLADPHIAHYIEGWGRPGDHAVVAETAGGEAIGAAWFRLFSPSDPGYGFVDESIPEVTIGVREDWRGRGVGGRLLSALIEGARDAGFPALSLSVEFDNPAAALYERHGFAKVGTNGGSWTMVRRGALGEALRGR